MGIACIRNAKLNLFEIHEFRQIQRVKTKAWALKMSDYARIDLRIDAAGRIYVIDPNCNPFFGPPKETHATYSIILDMYGIDFTETLKRIFVNTIRDYQNN